MGELVSSQFGWVDNPVLNAVTQAQCGLMPLFQTAPGMTREPITLDKDVLLYKAWKDVLAEYPDYPAQEIGDCVSHGNGRGHDLIQCVEIVLGGASNKLYRETCTEALYGAAREAGNMLGSSDGCYGSAAVKAMTTIGMVPRELVGPYSGKRAKDWGRRGIPTEIRQAAAQFKLGGAALVTNTDEAMVAIHNGYTIAVCSTVGFEGRGGFRRDAAGFCYAGGSWPHCMFICGYIGSDGRPSFVFAQSWGPTMPSGPQPFDLPPFCFRVESPTVARMLAAKDSYVLSKAAKFVPRPIPSHWTNAGWAA